VKTFLDRRRVSDGGKADAKGGGFSPRAHEYARPTSSYGTLPS
jgi:hypothetical protein